MELNNLSDVQVNVQYVSGKLIVDLAVTGIIGIPVSLLSRITAKASLSLIPAMEARIPVPLASRKPRKKLHAAACFEGSGAPIPGA